MLIVEDEEGHYEPLTTASTIKKGKEMAQHDLRFRLKCLEKERRNPGLCPYIYKLWSGGLGGVHQVAATWNAKSELVTAISRGLPRQLVVRDLLERPAFFVVSLLPSPRLPPQDNHIAIVRGRSPAAGPRAVFRAREATLEAVRARWRSKRASANRAARSSPR